MSICFYHQGILYSDKFQILDYKNYIKNVVDNKIYETADKNAVIAVMGKVPADMNKTLERIERITSVCRAQIKTKKDYTEILKMLKASLEQLKMSFILVVYFNKTARVIVRSLYTNSKDNSPTDVKITTTNETVSLYGPRTIPALLDAGMPPERIFYGVSTYSNTVTKSYTAYDLTARKFI